MNPMRGSGSRLTRSPSFSIAVLRSSTIMMNTIVRIKAMRFHVSAARRNARGMDSRKAKTSWRNASSLRATARSPFQLLMAARHRRNIVESGHSAQQGAKRRILASLELTPRCQASALHAADPRRTGFGLDGARRFELLAVEAQHLDFLLDHALDQQGTIVLAEQGALAP